MGHISCIGAFSPLFGKNDKPIQDYLAARCDKALRTCNDKVLHNKNFLCGDKLTVADIYLYIVLGWCPYVAVTLENYPNLAKYVERVNAVEGVGAAWGRMKAEGAKPKKILLRSQ